MRTLIILSLAALLAGCGPGDVPNECPNCEMEPILFTTGFNYVAEEITTGCLYSVGQEYFRPKNEVRALRDGEGNHICPGTESYEETMARIERLSQ